LNTFKIAPHSGYLCLKVLATFGIIIVFGSQKEARSIERGFTPGHKNVHFLREDADQHEQAQPSSKQEISVELKKELKLKVTSADWHSTPEYQIGPSASVPK
jgi:hypothetical protein